MDESKFPPGVTQLRRGDGDDVTIGETTAPGDRVTISNPTMSGIQVQVQHPTLHASEATADPGLFAGMVAHTEFGPLICVQTKHHDGTTLTVMMTLDEAREWHDVWNALCQRAIMLAPAGAS